VNRNILGLALGQITQTGPGSADELIWRRRSDVSLTEEPGKTRRREAPHESEELYRLLAEHSTDMISKHTPEGVYTYASPACRSLLGYDPEDLVGHDAYEFFHPDDLETVQETHSAILERPDTYAVCYRIRRKDGSYAWFETTSRTVRDPETDEVLEIIAVSRDVTERKRAEERVLFQAHLLEQVQAAVIATDMQGTVTHWNEHAERLYGWSREEALGRRITELTVGAGEAEPLAEEIMRRVRAGKTWEGEFAVRRKDGSAFPAHVTDSLIRDAEGRAVGIVGVSTDITERKRLEESLREIREAERRRIARDLHDVVLQDLMGALQGMQAAQIESEKPGLEQEIAALRRAVASLRNAIYDLRFEKEQPFVRAVESLVELNRQLTPEREIRLTVRDGFPPELPDGADVELLRVLQEALINARRHSAARRVEVILSTERRVVQAEVADDGRGFDPASVQEGLGISGMRERASALGGRLEIESAPGEGTSVKVEAPL
jgi:PAS domain S-box-containing protein